MKTTYIIVLIALLIATSCKDNTENIELQDFRELIINDRTSIKLAEQFNAKQRLDTVSFSTTYEFQEYILVNNTYAIGCFNVLDIMKKDSSFQIEIDISIFPNFNNLTAYDKHRLNLDCTNEQLQMIDSNFPDNIEKSKGNFHKSDIYLIVNLHTLQKRVFSSFDFIREIIDVVQE